MNETETRAELIDKQLAAAGWRTEGAVQVRREYSIDAGEIGIGGRRARRLIADYVLIYKNRKLAVVEAKNSGLAVGEGVAQAKLYAQKLHLATSFAANGLAIYQICHQTGAEGPVAHFPTPEALWQKTFAQQHEAQRQWLERFNAVPFEDLGGTKQARYYQELAVNKAMEAIAGGKQRLLLTLATGTGKTFIAFQIAWKLFKSRWNKQRDGVRQPRLLFLADRNILAGQAYLDFSAFDNDALVRITPGEIRKGGEVPQDGSVFFTIFQTFMSGADGKPFFGEYARDFFDFIIIDECHRGGANEESTWRKILEHFDGAVQLGLTATPKRDDNVDTYQYFGEPIYVYSLKEGIEDGFLTPFKVKRIQSTIDDYVYEPDDEVLAGEVAIGRVYKEDEFNRSITIKEREIKRVQDLLAAINPQEKTIVFCANQSHAAAIRDLINQQSTSTDIDYCVRVTANDGAIGDTYLKQFQDNEKLLPTILTTSHKLSTGVDARNVRNIVLLRSVHNMIEFKQIIGRGTRLYDDKHYFTLVDFVGAYYNFLDAEWDGVPIEPVNINYNGDVHDEITSIGEIQDAPNGKYPDGPRDEHEQLEIRLADGKVRALQSTIATYFYAGGIPIDAKSFLHKLYATLQLPSLFKDETELRELWANPLTRKELLEKLDREGCPKSDLIHLQTLVNAQDSDLFDVLQYVAYAKPIISREARVQSNRDNIYTLLNAQQRQFVAYVLDNYIRIGVDELDDDKLVATLNAQYHSLDAARQQLGDDQEIRHTFINFQAGLYKAAS